MTDAEAIAKAEAMIGAKWRACKDEKGTGRRRGWVLDAGGAVLAVETGEGWYVWSWPDNGFLVGLGTEDSAGGMVAASRAYLEWKGVLG